ncbi:MAG: phenylalanine--tRNA ligase subunit beta, partial [Thermocrispum sp.]
VIADVADAALTVEAAEQAPWHPGRCARLLVGDWPIGYAGELHPTVIESLGLPQRTVAMELDLDAIPVVETRPAPSVSPYPPVLLDVALVVDATVPAASVAAALRKGGGQRLEDVTLFDVYTGEQVGDGRQSLAFNLRFRDQERTLTVEEATALRDDAVAAADQAFGATLRG